MRLTMIERAVVAAALALTAVTVVSTSTPAERPSADPQVVVLVEDDCPYGPALS